MGAAQQILLSQKITGGGFAAIAFDAASNSGAKFSTASFNWLHTCTGTNRALVVGVGFRDSSAPTVTGITYNGVALTKLRSSDAVFRAAVELWYLANPASGSNSIAVTLSGALGEVCGAGAISFTGVDQTTPMDVAGGAGATYSAGGNTTTATVNIVTVTDNAWTFAVMAAQSDLTSFAIGSNQTQRWHISLDAFSAGETAGATSNAAVTPAGSKTMNWDFASVGGNWAIAAGALRPASL